MNIQKIIPNLWFDSQAEEAARFYVSVFPNSSVGNITYYTEAGKEIHGRPAGSVMTVDFVLDGVPFVGLNGGPHFRFNEAVSFVVNCDSQEETDMYWNRLGEGGDPKAQQCGWLKDNYGLSWQIVPKRLNELFAQTKGAAADRLMNAMLKMKKLEIKELEAAVKGA